MRHAGTTAADTAECTDALSPPPTPADRHATSVAGDADSDDTAAAAASPPSPGVFAAASAPLPPSAPEGTASTEPPRAPAAGVVYTGSGSALCKHDKQ